MAYPEDTLPRRLANAANAANASAEDDADLVALYWQSVQLGRGWRPGADALGVVLCCAVFLLSPVILCGNALLLSALYRFKRLRTPSNYLLASLASSDLGVGVLLPVCAYLEVVSWDTSPAASATVATGAASAALCALPHCLLTSLCCASLLVMSAIAVDRFTSLAQPLRYNNLITHSSVERYIAGLWLYAAFVGFVPLAARLWWYPGLAACSGTALLGPPGVAVFLMCSVYAPCVVLVVGCYSYVYLVARTHHRAIYSVEISLRHAQDTPSRYTSTLAITVGLFVCLWLPFQVVIVVDLVRGYPLLASLPTARMLCLSLPMFASSALNPWVYGYRNGEVRAAVQRVLDELLTKLGLSSPHLGCPHLVTTGADAELNSFASNMRLCTVSASPMRTTLLLLPSTNSAHSLAPATPVDADTQQQPPTPPTTSTSALAALATRSTVTLAETVIELRSPPPPPPPREGSHTTPKRCQV